MRSAFFGKRLLAWACKQASLPKMTKNVGHFWSIFWVGPFFIKRGGEDLLFWGEASRRVGRLGSILQACKQGASFGKLGSFDLPRGGRTGGVTLGLGGHVRACSNLGTFGGQAIRCTLLGAAQPSRAGSPGPGLALARPSQLGLSQPWPRLRARASSPSTSARLDGLAATCRGRDALARLARPAEAQQGAPAALARPRPRPNGTAQPTHPTLHINQPPTCPYTLTYHLHNTPTCPTAATYTLPTHPPHTS